MNALDRASGALVTLRGKLDSQAPGDHRAHALDVLMDLWAAGLDDEWLRGAVAELWSGRMGRVELRACVDRCLGRVSVALVAEAAPRRTTILPPPSGVGDELGLEREAARRSLSSVDLAVTPLGWEEVVPKHSTVPASADWWIDAAAEMRAAG
ncbi:hypothetical protein [Sorangium sp. So ce233]|uniref:hypothetical protein n=1 Tax=Sorangium sp. So ce233 TaxID=3133290 RepID=UPI003F6190BB